MKDQSRAPDITLPKDLYSSTLREKRGNPEAVEKVSMIDLSDHYGNVETWTVRTIRTHGLDVVFLQRINATGGDRWVLPAEVMLAIAQQRAGATTVNRKRGARKAAATRKADRVPGRS